MTAPAATKKCPACAEDVNVDALICRYCGFDFVTLSRPGPAPVATKTNGLAVASLVLGIVWVYWIGSVLAVIFGHVALNQIKESGGTQGGRGMAIAGLVLGYVGIGFVAIVIFLIILGASLSN